ncbi:MAG: acetyltransferase [Roseibium sp.]|uniref:GNAT family N-acetyltransferase n=1 Tax=Roseibium sp. TaxID=1936156 RepID=UPI002628596C|nr:GNAT family N-acetyltransferase [Roseibium sp.]MCV0424044.1 acetyltransferase [Roseibium sp.]
MISFRPVLEEDLELLAAWMQEPHWREWWGNPETELRNIEEKVAGRDSTRPYIFQKDGVDKGYIQVWFVRDQQNSDYVNECPWLTLLPSDAVGVDLSIGLPEDLSSGLGTQVLRAFVRKLLNEGYSRILIDPDPKNKRAVRCYRKVGFEVIPELVGKTDDSLLMEFINTEGVS